MPPLLKAVLILFPFVELALLAQVAAAFGFIPTLGLLLIAASLGAAIIRLRGLTAVMHLQKSMSRGQPIGAEMLHDGISALGGLLLIIPGPMSDVMGLLLQISWVQKWLGQRLIRLTMSSWTSSSQTTTTIIEGEYHRAPDSKSQIDSERH